MNKIEFRIMRQALLCLKETEPLNRTLFLDCLASFSAQPPMDHLEKFWDDIFAIYGSYFDVRYDDPVDIWVKALNHLITAFKSEIFPSENIFKHRYYRSWLISELKLLWYISRGELDKVLATSESIFKKEDLSSHLELYTTLTKIAWPRITQLVCQQIFDFLLPQDQLLISDLDFIGIQRKEPEVPKIPKVRFSCEPEVQDFDTESAPNCIRDQECLALLADDPPNKGASPPPPSTSKKKKKSKKRSSAL